MVDIFGMYFDKDKMTTKRFKDTENERGHTVNALCEHVIGEPCHLSFRTADRAIGNDDSVNLMHTVNTVYCNSDIDILKGDNVTITRGCGIKYIGIAGKPNHFRRGRQMFVLEGVGKA